MFISLTNVTANGAALSPSRHITWPTNDTLTYAKFLIPISPSNTSNGLAQLFALIGFLFT